MNIPQHPDQHDKQLPVTAPTRARTKIIIAAALAVVIIMIVLHIAGVAPH